MSFKFKITLVASLVFLLILVLLGYIFFSVIDNGLQTEMAAEARQICNEAAYLIEKSVCFDAKNLKSTMARPDICGSDFSLNEKLSALQDITRCFDYEYMLLFWDGTCYRVSRDSISDDEPDTQIAISTADQTVVFGAIFSGEEAGLLISVPAKPSEDGVWYQLALKRNPDSVFGGLADTRIRAADHLVFSAANGRVLYPAQSAQMTIARGEDGQSAMTWATLSEGGAERGIYACSMQVGNMPFYVTSYIDREDIGLKLRGYAASFAAIAGCSVVLLAAAIFWLSRRMARLVTSLAGVVENADRPEELPVVFTKRRDEAGLLARAVSSLLERLQSSIEEKEYIAYHDNLTDLPNRYLMEQDITEMLFEGKRFAFALMDIDNFKSVNDLYGHMKGDLLIYRMAALLRSLGPETLKAYRWGGDEFVLLLTGDTKESYCGILDDIYKAVSAGLEGLEAIQFSVSIGICIYPEIANSQEALLQYADTSLNEAKQSGKGQYRFYE